MSETVSGYGTAPLHRRIVELGPVLRVSSKQSHGATVLRTRAGLENDSPSFPLVSSTPFAFFTSSPTTH